VRFVAPLPGWSTVASRSIRPRILKGAAWLRKASPLSRCIPFDPSEDTESKSLGMKRLKVGHSCIPFDPSEDTESEKGFLRGPPLLVLHPVRSVRGY